ncbi:indole-3-glycerol phosphate synthase TrpC [Virgibacillus kekensis]|uniref:Indole-3-glycerol phosphate synthase n=1 Tax=Virgibacillus kekensis TaxID=202261 RepID=A0ABV9DM99_9BACI
MTILTKILKKKKQEVEQLKKQPGPLRETGTSLSSIPKIADTFRNRERMNIIAEIKRASPSKGEIDMTVNPAARAKQYESYGASAISVLTDKTFFKGSMDYLQQVRTAVNLPVLCKDFFIDKVQIDQAKSAGASVILLIVASLQEKKLNELYTYATELGLEVLCEVHNEQEMETALRTGAKIIGINNRDLNTFEVDLETTGRLSSMVKNSDTILISESGIKTGKDVLQVAGHGANGILIGETLMRSENLQATFEELRKPLTKEGQFNAR